MLRPSEGEAPSRRIPTLVQCCQRVAIQHVDLISGFGDDLRYELIKPILESCTAEILLRLEQASPHLQMHTPEIWKDMCFRTYPLAMEQYTTDDLESWKDEFFVLHEAEAKRLEELGTRLRIKRLIADEEKKEREVKITDRIPPTKRSRTGWSTSSQPKTLIQKTRSEVSRIQKSMYRPQMVPRMPNGKEYRVLHNTLSAKLPQTTSTSPNRTMNTVYRHNPTTRSSSATTSSASSSASSPTSFKSSRPIHSTPTKMRTAPLPSSTKIPPESPPKAGKKDPMATLFMPKHRAHSQLPGSLTCIS